MKLQISYQTLQVPPPYSMAYTLDIDVTHEVHVAINIEYLDRDELSDDEIFTEGFTTADDFRWTGVLPLVWKKAIVEYFDHVVLIDKSEDVNHWLYLKSQSKTGHLVSPESHLYFLQQLIQAIYEKAEREAPFQLKVITIEGKTTKKIQVKASFVDRTFHVNNEPKDWSQLQDFMSALYHDEPTGNPKEKPSQEGIWVDFFGEGQFFKLQNMPKKHLSNLNKILQ